MENSDSVEELIAEKHNGNRKVFIALKPLDEIRDYIYNLQTKYGLARCDIGDLLDKQGNLESKLQAIQARVKELEQGRPVWDNSKAAALLQEENHKLRAEIEKLKSKLDYPHEEIEQLQTRIKELENE